MSRINISLAQKDIQLVRQLRSCLTNQTVNLGSLENLLTVLEGKIEKPSSGKQKRKVLKHNRAAKYMIHLTGGKLRPAV